MSNKNLIRFDTVFYDSKTRNLLLTFCGKPTFTQGDVGREDISSLLGVDLLFRLELSRAPAASGWEFTLKRDSGFWLEADGSLVSRMLYEDGLPSEYVLRADNLDGKVLAVDVQRRGSEVGDECMSLTAGVSADGQPQFAVHDAEGIWAGNLYLRQDGKVELTPGNYVSAAAVHDANEESGPSYDDILSRLAGEMERPGSDPYETLKMIANALVQAPPKALESIMQLTPAD